MRMQVALVVASARDWADCITAVHSASWSTPCRAYMVDFDWEVYGSRLGRQPRGVPRTVRVCAPESCTEEMVARYVAPVEVLEEFSPESSVTWRRALVG